MKIKVTDNTGQPLTGANVFTSDSDGNYSGQWAGATDTDGFIELPTIDGITHFTFSFVGLEPLTIAADGLPTVVTLMADDETNLNAVNVQGAALPPATNYGLTIGIILILIAVVGGFITYAKNNTIRK